MSFGGPQMGGASNPNNDFQVANPPSDGISSLSWSPTSNFLVATSWDCDVLCYEVQANGQAVPKASIKHDAPVLCSAWNADGSAVFSGGCDNQVKKWDLATNQPTQVAGHDAPIRHLAWIQEVGGGVARIARAKAPNFSSILPPPSINPTLSPALLPPSSSTPPRLFLFFLGFQYLEISCVSSRVRAFLSPLVVVNHHLRCFARGPSFEPAHTRESRRVKLASSRLCV